MCPHEPEQVALALVALGTDLREPRGDDADGPHAMLERGTHSLEDGGRRNADDGEVDWVRKFRDRAVPAHARDRLAAAVDWVGRARVVAVEDVAEELTAYRPATRRGAEHGNGPRLEERAEGRHDGGVVTLGDERRVVGSGGDRERHLDLTAVQRPRHVETHPLEDTDHRGVVGHHLTDESFDSVGGGAGG